MTEKATGEIQNIRKDFKGIQINNDWFSSFKPLVNIKKGDNIELEFTIKGQFKNIKSYKLIEPKWSKEIDSNYKEPIDYPGDLLEYKKPISDTTINCILMQSVQHSLNKGYTLDKSTEEVIKSYKKIRELI